jgi:ribonuclease Z
MKLGAQVTCLIHEATFQNSKLDEAVKKKHSTLSEALLVSKEMDARITILTHFSQRYPKVPVLEEDNSVDFSAHNIVCANDLMHIKLKDAWKSGLYMKDELDLEKRLEELRMQGTLPAEAQEDIVNE